MQNIKISSEKSFGLTFSVIFLLISIYLFFVKGNISYVSLTFSLFFLVTAFFFPKILKFPNILWFKFGELLSKIVTPFILASLFYLVITPMGLLFRMFSKKKSKTSRWVLSNKNQKCNFRVQF